jgi:hypothetical protein
MLSRLLARVFAAWSRPPAACDLEPPASPLESAGVDLADLDLDDPEDLFAALRRVVNHVRLEAWRASRIPPHLRHRAAAGALSIYSSQSTALDISEWRAQRRAAG